MINRLPRNTAIGLALAAAQACAAAPEDERALLPSPGGPPEPATLTAAPLVEDDLGAPAVSMSADRRERLLAELAEASFVCGSASPSVGPSTAGAPPARGRGGEDPSASAEEIASIALSEPRLSRGRLRGALAALARHEDGMRWLSQIERVAPQLARRQLATMKERRDDFGGSEARMLGVLTDRIRAQVIAAARTARAPEGRGLLARMSEDRAGTVGRAAGRALSSLERE